MIRPNLHYCKHCNIYFNVKIHDLETGDFFLICPNCNYSHYRYFENGKAIHCDINQRKSEPITLKGF